MSAAKARMTGKGGGAGVISRLSTLVNACTNDLIKSQKIPFDKEASEYVIRTLECRDTEGHLNCAYCLAARATTEDHFEPLVRKGRPTGAMNDASNMVPCCSTCNSSKGGKRFEEWRPALATSERFANYIAYREDYKRTHPVTLRYDEAAFLALVEEQKVWLTALSDRMVNACKPALALRPRGLGPVPDDEISDIDDP
jgi:hypothetical protein